MMIALMCFVKLDVLASAESGYKLLKLDLKNESSLLSTLSVKIFRPGASSELKKMKTVQDTKISQFQSSARNLLIKLIEKMQERSPLVFKVTHLSALYPTQIVSVKHTTLET